jgi:hypothetical protein
MNVLTKFVDFFVQMQRPLSGPKRRFHSKLKASYVHTIL